MPPPKALFKLLSPEASWDRIPLTDIEYVTDLKDAIKTKASPLLDTYAPSQLSLSATVKIDDASQAKELDARKGLASVLKDLDVSIPDEDIASVQKSFAENIWLFVSTPTVAQVSRKRELVDDEGPSKRPKNVLDLYKYWFDTLSLNVPISSPPELFPEDVQKLAGRFRKNGQSHLPIGGIDFVDMRLSKTCTAMGQRLIDDCKNGANLIHVLFAVSGAGKTRAILDIAMQNQGIFLMYIECHPGTNEDNITNNTRLEPTRDRNFANLYEEMNTVDFKHGLGTPQGQLEARRLIALEYTSRIFYLILLSHTVENLTPDRYLLSQLNGGQETIGKIKRFLARESTYDLKQLFSESLSRLPDVLHGSQLVIAIDEASVGAKLFPAKFENQNKSKCGLLTPILEFLNSHKVPIVVAGTSFTLQHGRQILSDVGKGVSQNYLSEFETLTIDEVKAYIEDHLDLSGCKIEEIKNWYYLAGRPRLAARLLLEIVQAEKIYGDKSKQDILEIAVNQTVVAIDDRLSIGLSALAKRFINSIDPLDHPMQNILEEFFLSCRFFGGIAQINTFDNDSTRLIGCGIASLKQIANCNFVQIEEPLAVKVVNTVLGLEYTKPKAALIANLFRKLVKDAQNLDTTSKGKAWEYLVLAALLKHNGKKAIDLIHMFYADDQVFGRGTDEGPLKIFPLPEWTKNAIFNVESFGNRDMLSLLCNKLYTNGVDIIRDWLDFPVNRKYILQPENIMRPDGLYIGSIEQLDANAISSTTWESQPSQPVGSSISQSNPLSNEYWTLLLSEKFFNEPMTGKKVDEDKTSTNWSLIYHTKDNTKTDEKQNCYRLLKDLEEVKKGYVHYGSLRIHFILPNLASSRDKSDRGGCRVEGNDVIMYVDKTMLGGLFDSNTARRINDLLK